MFKIVCENYTLFKITMHFTANTVCKKVRYNISCLVI